jgi:hypothetical protein
MLTYDVSPNSPPAQCFRECYDDSKLNYVWNHKRRSHPYSTYKVSACMCMHRRELDMSKGCADVTEEDEELRPTCIYAFWINASVGHPDPVETSSFRWRDVASRNRPIASRRMKRQFTAQAGFAIKIIIHAPSRPFERLPVLGSIPSCEVKT